MVGWVEWLVLTVVMTWTVVLVIHVGKLGRAFRSDDWTLFRALNRQTMWLVGVWQISLAGAMATLMTPEDGVSWASVITLAGSGVGIIALDRTAKRFRVGAYER